jgi:DNA adenine methylase
VVVESETAQALASLVEYLHDKKAPTNVAQVRQLSPFRYPGGKTWLVPEVRKWLMASKIRPSVFVEPFAGGAIVGLSVAAEGLAEHVFLGELDDDVAAVWQTIS